MKLRVPRSEKLGGSVTIPGSKSHTIRSLFIASLADGESVIRAPLISKDSISAVSACRAFGAVITEEENLFKVKGFGRKPRLPENIIDVGNSGTTMIFSMSMASLVDGVTILTGDEQIRRRPVGPLIDALGELGVDIFSARADGNPPVVIKGLRKASKDASCRIDAQISQYLSSLLIHAPLFDRDIDIDISKLLEIPYVEMTLWWLNKFGIRYENEDFKHFHIYGKQSYSPFDQTIPGDFSSATFFAVLSAISGSEIFMKNLDMSDVQGDKEVVRMLERMGARITVKTEGLAIRGDHLTGTELDLGNTPDAICAMAVAGCFAKGETKIENVAQARLKETDRIAVMATELKKMGADIEERDDGLVVRHSALKGTEVDGHGDHRVAMSLAVAGLMAEGVTTISGAEAVSVTFPEFSKLIEKCGGNIAVID
ncbi:MAG: 3-phosphoshikimate 1-carboxyvinyltransferase [Synergistaceae bacterium]|jgi:3-phosphoshikimate 1-carboxyvinyltransferase|nr:3-phosphoshikimate 1-carboxyvinyltransferase [Synergistaceae bacterium]